MGIEDGGDNEQESKERQENVQAKRYPSFDQEHGNKDAGHHRHRARERQNQEPPALRSRSEEIDLRRLKVLRQCAHFVLQTQESDSKVLIEAEPRERRAESYTNGTEQAQT